MQGDADAALEQYRTAVSLSPMLARAHFAIGVEDAIFLRGELPLAVLDEGELDRVIGSLYAYVERCFRAALQIGFASRFSAR